jgi:hypothetical protein
MGMGWGMAQGLGQAIQKVGDIWGPQRLEMQRQQNEDARREAENVRRGEESKSLLKMQGVQTAGMEAEQKQNTELFPLKKTGLEADIESRRAATGASNAQVRQAQLEIQRLEEARAAM